MEMLAMLAVLFLFGYPVLVAALMRARRDGPTDGVTRERFASVETELREQLEFLTARLRQLEGQAQANARSASDERPAAKPAVVETPLAVPEPEPEPEPMAAAPLVEPPAPPVPSAPVPPVAVETSTAQPETQAAGAIAGFAKLPRVDKAEPPSPPAWLVAAKAWLFTGNLVAKFGLLILFIGVGFLLKYAAERGMIPIELRLAGVVLGDLTLLGFGWRVRDKRREIALPVQGAALAIMMLVVFGAFQRYQLIPAGFAFALLFVLTAFTCILAVLQNAAWLAAFGICGGFAAPLMVSTGQGSHIALFSYYALLNGGVLAIALKRSWRALNLLGFAFTFVIGAAWGVLKYEQVDYVSAQAFLALFFLFYVAVAIAYAAKQSLLLKHYVDATLVFATPVVAVGMQYALVRDKQYGMALSALALGLFYTALASVLWRRRGLQWKMLVESFLALGVVFGTLALPFALDQRWTSGAWALEGAGIVWIGLRQKRRLTWGFGLLVQAGAWLSFMRVMAGLDRDAAGSNIWLGFLLLAGAAFAMAVAFRKNGGAGSSPGFTRGANGLLAFAAVWLLGGAWGQLYVSAAHFPVALASLAVASALAVALLLVLLGRVAAWPVARWFAVAAQLLAGVAMSGATHIEEWYGVEKLLPGALMVFGASIISSRFLEKSGKPFLSGSMLAWAGWWWYMEVLELLTTWALRWHALMIWMQDFIEFGITRTHSIEDRHRMLAIGVAVSAVAFAHVAKRLAWPALRFLSAPAWLALAVAVPEMLFVLFTHDLIPGAPTWLAFFSLWLAAEYLMAYWPRQGWPLASPLLRALHLLRSAGPWLMIWPVATVMFRQSMYIDHDLYGELLERAGWRVDGSWGTGLAAWLMLAALVWLLRQARRQRWPTPPLSGWYRRYPLPAGAALALGLAAWMNVTRDGTMAPLPYLPLANPLDLTTALAFLVGVSAWRQWTPRAPTWSTWLPRAAKVAAYLWLNLILLRSAAQVLHIQYEVADLAHSQTVQAMLSLTWSLTALIVMRRAAGSGERAVRLRRWLTGAALLAVVVAKLFLADLANVGSVARIVSFVGVGVLMLVIGYLAPFPTAAAAAADADAEKTDPTPA